MLSKKIAALRKAKGISQEELADVLLTSRQAISKWERGESYPDIDRLKDLAIYFNVSIDYLLDYDVQSVSINSFIDRLAKGIQTRTFDIPVEEIRVVVSKNINNFDLLIKSIEYLADYWSGNRDDNAFALIIEYCKRAISIYEPDNKSQVSIKDLQSIIGQSMIIKGDYATARQYFKENRINGFETLEAYCELQLGNYKEAGQLLSGNYLQSFIKIVDGSVTQIGLFLRNNQTQEAYDLANWTISLIKSVSKSESFYFDVIYLVTFLKAICERSLNIDDKETIKFLKDNKSNVGNLVYSTDDLKFYYDQKTTFVAQIHDAKTTLYEEIFKKEDGKYKLGEKLYIEVFGED